MAYCESNTTSWIEIFPVMATFIGVVITNLVSQQNISRQLKHQRGAEERAILRTKAEELYTLLETLLIEVEMATDTIRNGIFEGKSHIELKDLFAHIGRANLIVCAYFSDIVEDYEECMMAWWTIRDYADNIKTIPLDTKMEKSKAIEQLDSYFDTFSKEAVSLKVEIISKLHDLINKKKESIFSMLLSLIREDTSV